MTDDDRRVHARSAAGNMEIVRYERPGRWFLEYERGSLVPYSRLTVYKAAELAIEWYGVGGHIFLGVPGGRRFDAIVRGRCDTTGLVVVSGA